jgi:hypothetical protein
MNYHITILAGGDVRLIIDGNNGARFVEQELFVRRVPSKIGGARFLVACPATGKMVRRLYLSFDDTQFRSRHELQLKYYSRFAGRWEQASQRADRLMDRLGMERFSGAVPPRPKYMQRKTYARLKEEISYARLRECGILEGWKARRIPRTDWLPEEVRESVNLSLHWRREARRRRAKGR